MMKFLNYSLSLSLSLSLAARVKLWNFHKKTSFNARSIFVKSYLSRGVAPGRSWFVGRAQRGDDKPRGRGRGRRNIDFTTKYLQIKKSTPQCWVWQRKTGHWYCWQMKKADILTFAGLIHAKTRQNWHSKSLTHIWENMHYSSRKS